MNKEDAAYEAKIEAMTEIVCQRIDEMVKDKEIQKILNSFETQDEAQEWITKVAVATLIIPVEDRAVN